jgi:hypothetical protein
MPRSHFPAPLKPKAAAFMIGYDPVQAGAGAAGQDREAGTLMEIT